MSSSSKEFVVLLHGICGSSKNMRKYERELLKRNYAVVNIDYPSRKNNLLALAEHVSEKLKHYMEAGNRMHFIGYSMGGLIIRALLNVRRPKNLGRVVLLGTPNGGSELADVFKSWWIFKKIYGPAGQDLCTSQQNIERLLGSGNLDYECGVIAGNISLSLFAWLFMKGSNDGRVAIWSAKIPGMRDFKIVRSSHVNLLRHKQTLDYAMHFIENGAFQDSEYRVGDCHNEVAI